jgi:hypothetical protein
MKRHSVVIIVATLLAIAVVQLGGPMQVNADLITDTFETSHDYAGGNVVGSIWDGVLNPNNLAVGNANITSPAPVDSLGQRRLFQVGKARRLLPSAMHRRCLGWSRATLTFPFKWPA